MKWFTDSKILPSVISELHVSFPTLFWAVYVCIFEWLASELLVHDFQTSSPQYRCSFGSALAVDTQIFKWAFLFPPSSVTSVYFHRMEDFSAFTLYYVRTTCTY